MKLKDHYFVIAPIGYVLGGLLLWQVLPGVWLWALTNHPDYHLLVVVGFLWGVVVALHYTRRAVRNWIQ